MSARFNEAQKRSKPELQALGYVSGRVARFFCVNPQIMHERRRGTAPTVRARQIVIYLAHVALGLSIPEIASLFGRDRSSVVLALRLIEDARDDEVFDVVLERLEALAVSFVESRK